MVYSVFEYRLSVLYSCKDTSTENNVIIAIFPTIYFADLHKAVVYGALVLYPLLKMPYMWLNTIYPTVSLKNPTFIGIFWFWFCLLIFHWCSETTQHYSRSCVSFFFQTPFQLKLYSHTGIAVQSRQNIPVTFFIPLPSSEQLRKKKRRKKPNQK